MATFRNPVLDGGPNAGHGDPFVLEDGGRYVLVHTGGTAVPAYESDDLVHWQRRGNAIRAAARPHGVRSLEWCVGGERRARRAVAIPRATAT